MNLLEKYFCGKKDAKIFYYEDIPAHAKAIIIIAHGYMEHGGRYVELGEQLVANGLGVCILDHRGNGHSEGTKGEVDSFFDFVEDIRCLVDKLALYQKPIITFGHSMGGLITFLYGLQYAPTLKGQIFSSPALGVPMGCKGLSTRFYENVGMLLKDAKIPRMGEVLSTRNPAYLQHFKEDKIVNTYATFHFMDQFLRVGVAYAQEHASSYKLPSLFLLGDKDYVIPVDRNQSLVTQLTLAPVTVHEYPRCMHDLFHDMPEEVSQIVADMLAWIDRMLQKE